MRLSLLTDISRLAYSGVPCRTSPYNMKNNGKVNKARVLVCGFAALTFIAIFLWKHAGYVGFKTRLGISWPTVEHARPG